MKILILSDLSRTQINGVLTTFDNTIKTLIAQGHDVQHINADQFKGYPCPGYPEIKLSLVTPKQIGKLIEDHNPEYIHIATEGPIGLAARWYLKGKKQKWSSSFHTKYAEFVEAKIGFGSSLIWKWLKKVYYRDSFILTTTETMKAELVSKGFDADKIGTWSRGVDRDIFKANAASPSEPVFLNVGRVSVEKNLEEFYKLDLPGRKIQVGDGPELATYKDLYPDVEFVGAKRGRELAEFYEQASVMVFPSVKDTFGVVIIESMSCGTPVAAYPVTGPIDIIEDGVTGVMNSDLEIAAIHCLTLDRKVVAENSKKFTWEAATELFVKSLIARH